MENRRTDSLSARNNNQKRKSIMCITVNVKWRAFYLKKKKASTLHNYYCSWLLESESWTEIKKFYPLIIKCLKYVKKIKLGCYDLLICSSLPKGIWKFQLWIKLFSLTSPLPFSYPLQSRSTIMTNNLFRVIFCLINLLQNNRACYLFSFTE